VLIIVMYIMQRQAKCYNFCHPNSLLTLQVRLGSCLCVSS
jgi:hypothetical protein